MRHGLDTSFLVAVEVAGHKDHRIARAIAESLRRRGDRFVIAPQVLAELLSPCQGDGVVAKRDQGLRASLRDALTPG